MASRPSLSSFLSAQSKVIAQPALGAAIEALAKACRQIASLSAHGALAGALGSEGTENVQGEVQKKLDVLADRALIEALKDCEGVVGIASEENEEPIWLHVPAAERGLMVLFDPLDGSSNIDVNVSVGTIFGVLSAPSGSGLEGILQPGRRLEAAGYAIYGPSTMFILSLGEGVQGFTLCPESAEFLLTHPDIRIPSETSEFAINASNERFWEPPVQRYISECKAGKTGPRGRDFNMRWIASMVADVHRLMMRGGVFMYPKDTKDPAKPGRLRLLYEANPMAYLVEQAGGRASTGRGPILDLQPEAIHQRVPVMLGSSDEIDRLESYHQS